VRTKSIRVSRLVQFPLLSTQEKTLLCQYLSRPRLDRNLKAQMQTELERQQTSYVRLQLPTNSRRCKERRRNWWHFIRGPIGGWEQKGKRVRRKWDPADRRFILSFAVIVESRKPLRAEMVYKGDVFEWWIARALVTGDIRQFFECWYCGKINWRKRSSARFCDDRCRSGYHRAMARPRSLMLLSPARQRKAYAEMHGRGTEVGLIDMPIASRSRETTLRRLRARRSTRRTAR